MKSRLLPTSDQTLSSLFLSLLFPLSHTLTCVQCGASGCWFGCSNLPLDKGQVQLPLFAALTRHFIMVSSSMVLWSALVLVTISHANTQTYTKEHTHTYSTETHSQKGVFHTQCHLVWVQKVMSERGGLKVCSFVVDWWREGYLTSEKKNIFIKTGLPLVCGIPKCYSSKLCSHRLN